MTEAPDGGPGGGRAVGEGGPPGSGLRGRLQVEATDAREGPRGEGLSRPPENCTVIP